MALELIASVSDEVLEERGQMIATVSQIYVDRELGVIDAVSLIVQPIRYWYSKRIICLSMFKITFICKYSVQYMYLYVYIFHVYTTQYSSLLVLRCAVC